MQSLARCLIAAAFAFAFAPLAWAQAWPAKPVRVIVNLAAGGSADIIARIFAPKLGEALGQPVVIENRVGASGSIGIEMVAKSAADGYTLLHSAGGPITINPHLYKLRVDVAKDLDPVAATARGKLFLVVRPSLPVHSVAELIAYARANPGKLNYGSGGTGTSLYIASEMLLHAEKIQATHVSYLGAGPALTALLGDQIDFLFDVGLALPHIKAGKLRVLAVAGAARTSFLPDIPTMVELGVDVDADTLNGVYAPAGTPREIVMRLNREINRIMQTGDARGALAAISAEAVTASPEEFAAMQRRYRDRFGAVIREANIRVD